MPPAPLPPWRLVAMTYERNDDGTGETLVVRHEFYGATEQRAVEIYHAHLQSDAFLRGCTYGGHYGPIVCRTETFLERLP